MDYQVASHLKVGMGAETIKGLVEELDLEQIAQDLVWS